MAARASGVARLETALRAPRALFTGRNPRNLRGGTHVQVFPEIKGQAKSSPPARGSQISVLASTAAKGRFLSPRRRHISRHGFNWT